MKRAPGKGSRDRSGVRPGREWLRDIMVHALAACDAGDAVRRACRIGDRSVAVAGRSLSLRGSGRLMILAFGKAAPAMLDGLMQAIGRGDVTRPVEALLVAPGPLPRPSIARANLRLRRIAAEHPVPGRGSFRAGREALRFLAGARSVDDVLFLVSGGGSALLAAPLSPFVTQADKARLHRALVVSGAPIGAINTVRRHLSAVKGGRLAAAARRARTQTSLVLCDVDPQRFDEVASGPSLPDPTTIDDLIAVVDRFGLPTLLSPEVLEALRRGALPESPKPGDPIFRRSVARCILSNRDLRNAAAGHSRTKGLLADASPFDLTGAVDEGVETVARAIEGAPPGARLLVLGGEVVTTPSGPGRGGRAQELALRLALRMRRLKMYRWAFLAAGSDGIDGNSPAAGAFTDWTTLARAARAHIDPGATLAASDTYRFFHRLGDDVTLPAGTTNVRDLYLLLTGEAPKAGGARVDPATGDREPSPPESGS